MYPAYYIAPEKLDQNGNQLYQTKYIQNIVVFNDNGKVTYLKDKQLYDWLKNDQWKTEFTTK